QNITVWAYNSTIDTLSAGSISQNTQLLNNNITITNTSDWDGSTGENVYVDFDVADLDSDTPTFSCDRIDLFADFDTSTGQGNWTATDNVTYVNFGVSDGYGSIDNYTMSITGDLMPEDPEDLFVIADGLWMNHSWQTGGQWHLISGENDGDFFGYNWTGSAWQTDDIISSGLVDIGSHSTPSIFYMNNTWYLISGIYHGIFTGYNWTGSTWQSDTAIISGLTSESGAAHTVFDIDGTFYCVIGTDSSVIKGFKWTGTTWESNAAIISGITGLTGEITAESLEKDGDHYLIMGSDGNYPSGYKWNGTGWQSNATIVSGIAESDTEGYIYAAYVTGEVAV
ncbi:MAG: hypothetical protein KAI25_04800, partial [Hyphomicrobiaceae bacterium]|nr:hypothetical protein [Hyphomicrobiaceae bacterium]